MQILHLEEIKRALESKDLLAAIEAGFVAYSAGEAVVPPVAELRFQDPPGDVHIKYGYIKGDDYYVIKVASGFYDNPRVALPSSNGMMLLFDQKTGVPLCILLDEGYLTDLRTAIAGAVAARHLAPKHVRRIGIVGTGTQARLQLRFLKGTTACRQVLVWGRHSENLARYREAMVPEGFSIETTLDARDVGATCNLIVTATPSESPLLWHRDVRGGTHITALGSDTPEKQELDPQILQTAGLVVADSIAQCLVRGEISHAVRGGFLSKERIIELGRIVSGHCLGRTNDDEITVADLTGVAVQDIQIATAAYDAVRGHPGMAS